MDAAVPSSQPARPITETAARVRELVLCHVESFNYMLDEGLKAAVDDIPVREMVLEHAKDKDAAAGAAADGAGAGAGANAGGGKVLRFWFEDPRIGFPTHKGSASDARLFPWHCREAGSTYAAPLSATLCRVIDDGSVDRIPLKLGDAPIMIRSNRCHLANLSPTELVERNEEQVEAGGYFICNGIERIVRMLQVRRTSRHVEVLCAVSAWRVDWHAPH